MLCTAENDVLRTVLSGTQHNNVIIFTSDLGGLRVFVTMKPWVDCFKSYSVRIKKIQEFNLHYNLFIINCLEQTSCCDGVQSLWNTKCSPIVCTYFLILIGPCSWCEIFQVTYKIFWHINCHLLDFWSGKQYSRLRKLKLQLCLIRRIRNRSNSLLICFISLKLRYVEKCSNESSRL